MLSARHARDLGSGSQIPDKDKKYEMSFWWYYLALIIG